MKRFVMSVAVVFCIGATGCQQFGRSLWGGFGNQEPACVDGSCAVPMADASPGQKDLGTVEHPAKLFAELNAEQGEAKNVQASHQIATGPDSLFAPYR